MAVTRSSTRTGSAPPSDLAPRTPASKTPRPSSSSSKRSSASLSSSSRKRGQGRSAAAGGWSHAPTALTLLWLGLSLPLVAWDTGYVLGRPATMEGGRWHWPLWAPYKLYATVDYMYGWPALNARNGFTAAQGMLNFVETLMYAVYLLIWATRAQKMGSRRRVGGRAGALAVLVAFGAAVMTFSKTVLYWANEYFSGFDNIGHNPPKDLVLLWIIPNGAWLVGSAYMICSLGGDILDGLATSSRSKIE